MRLTIGHVMAATALAAIFAGLSRTHFFIDAWAVFLEFTLTLRQVFGGERVDGPCGLCPQDMHDMRLFSR